MKQNFIVNFLIPMWVFKMVCKLAKIYFEVLRRRSALRRNVARIQSDVIDDTEFQNKIKLYHREYMSFILGLFKIFSKKR